MTTDDQQRRSARWRGLLGIALARVRRQTRSINGQLVATVLLIAVTVAILLLTTGVALALAEEQAIDHDADSRVLPGESDVQSSVAGVEDPRLGASHERATLLSEHEGVTHATPVLAEPIAVNAPERERAQYVLLVGVVPGPESRTVAGLPTAGLEPGDPHYAGGTYDGPPSEEIVLSAAAAETLDASTDDSLILEGDHADADRTISVTRVEETAGSDSELPVALVHLSELQSLTGASEGELADQVLVWGDEAAARDSADEVYPNATVETGSTTAVGSLFDDTLALVTSVLALLVAIAICSLFIATTAGLTVEADRQTLATLGAVGFPIRSRLVIVAVTTIATTSCGAILGIGIGVVGIMAVNAIATATIAPGAVATVHPLFVPYAFAVALLSALLALPYPLALAARTDILAEVGR